MINNSLRFFGPRLFPLLLVGCGDSTPTPPTSPQDMSSATDMIGSQADMKDTTQDMPDQADMGTTASTADVYCDLSKSGDQRLVYTLSSRMGAGTPVDETLAYRYAWSCETAQLKRSLSGNGVPDHAVTNGSFATRLSAQNVNFTITLTPKLGDAATPIRETGYALNSVKFDPATAGTCPDLAQAGADCNYAGGRDRWHMVATPGQVSPWRFQFGVDENDAHVQPNGQYHYHGNPVSLVASLNADYETSMTLVGWAADGFPIYSIYGHSTPDDPSSPMTKLRSSYQTQAAPEGRPTIEDFPLGHFEEDWTYVARSGDLDECNGRLGVTPEFPNGIYHYYITETYPFVPRCVKGQEITVTAMMGPPPGM